MADRKETSEQGEAPGDGAERKPAAANDSDKPRESTPGAQQGGDKPSAATGPAIDVDSAHDRAS